MCAIIPIILIDINESKNEGYKWIDKNFSDEYFIIIKNNIEKIKNDKYVIITTTCGIAKKENILSNILSSKNIILPLLMKKLFINTIIKLIINKDMIYFLFSVKSLKNTLGEIIIPLNILNNIFISFQTLLIFISCIWKIFISWAANPWFPLIIIRGIWIIY